MPNNRLPWPDRWQARRLCVILAAAIAYASTVVGPAGLNFVPREPMEALQALLDIGFVPHGSDQRADWIGNLLMLIPFGFLAAGAVWPRHDSLLRGPAFIFAAGICLATILTIKYLQLFFPPRTVTLNYVTAQAVGGLLGCLCFVFWRGRVIGAARRQDAVAGLVIALQLYLAALALFVLMPLDIALNWPDLQGQIARLPATVTLVAGEGRPLPVRIAVFVASVLAFAPVGVLLTFVSAGAVRVRRGLPAVTAFGLLITSGLFAISTLVISAAPAIGSIFWRTCGVVLGAVAIRWLVRRDMDRLRLRLTACVPWLGVPYLLALMLVTGVLSTRWQTPAAALSHAYKLGFLPLFDYYIVSKADAAKNIVAHTLLYMPVGIALWLRHPDARVGGRAFLVGSGLSLLIELGRYLRPGLEGDVNAVVLAGCAAAATTRLMPLVWSLLATLAAQSNVAPSRHAWRTTADKLVAMPKSAQEAVGDIEHF